MEQHQDFILKHIVDDMPDPSLVAGDSAFELREIQRFLSMMINIDINLDIHDGWHFFES